MVTPLWPFAQTLKISALLTSMITADPFVAILFLSQINTLRLDDETTKRKSDLVLPQHHVADGASKRQIGWSQTRRRPSCLQIHPESIWTNQDV